MDPIDAARFRTVLGHFASGVVVVTGMDGRRPVGFTCQSFFSLSLDPPLVAIGPSFRSRSWPAVAASGAFCANILSAEQEALCRNFAVSGGDKFAGVGWSPVDTGSPRLDGALAWVDCRIEAVHRAGDHFLAIGSVVDLAAADGEPLVFYRAGFGSFRS
ncbi:MAG: flavin reductase family protein [Acidimicrobiales bacterium]